jgi:hypothetical protein
MNRKLADSFKEGYEAFSRVVVRKGKYRHVAANPMKKNTTPYKEWQRGWEAAYFKNLEKQNGLGTRS